MGSLRFMQIVGYQNEHLLNDMINSVAVRFTRDKDYFPEDYVLKTKSQQCTLN